MAIAATVVDQFGRMPAMRIQRIGYGAGSRDFPNQANLLRLLVGHSGAGVEADQVWILETNLDDVSGEIIGHTSQMLLDAGALDVYTTAIQMKKNRPGVMLSVICGAERREELEAILFRETTTLGIRRWPAGRHKLPRRSAAVQTPWGSIAGKIARLGEEERFSPEYEACRTAAAEHGVPLKEVFEAALRLYAEHGALPRSSGDSDQP